MIEKVWYVTVYTRNFERAAEFYEQTLGLPLRFRSAEEGYASFGMNGTFFAVSRVDPDSPKAARLAGRETGIAFGVKDIASAYEHLKGKGVCFTMPPTPQPWGGTLAVFTDPDGNAFTLDELHSEQ
jgi:predicted enzyme related to lactoylglutathione lyase